MAGPKSSKRVRSDDDDSDIEVETKATKTNKKTKTDAGDLESGKDNEGNPFWSLSGKRRVGISEFKKQHFINIREHWTDKDGVVKPGKKGISLSLEQYNALLKVIPAINAELTSQGLEVAGAPPGASASTTTKKSTTEDRRKAKKSNIEATSDEEEEDD